MYYLYTSKAYFGKTHIVAGYGEEFAAGCGMKWKRDTTAWRDMKKERVRKVKRTMWGTLWPELKDIGVTCSHCLKNGYPPILSRQRASPTSPKALPPPETPEEEEVGFPDLHRRQQGGMDVDLR